jgi:hypothetical protein
MHPQTVKLSLNIVHPTHDLSDVCDALGFQPNIIWKKGDEGRTPKGNKIGGVREYSRCSINFGPAATESLAKKLEAALVLLKPHQTLLRGLSSSGGKLNFFVGLFCGENTVEMLDLPLLEAMVELKIELYQPAESVTLTPSRHGPPPTRSGDRPGHLSPHRA